MLQLILASASPRRRDLLRDAGYSFLVCPVKLSEIFDESLTPEGVAEDLARQKAEACLEQFNHLKLQDNLILAADTVVAVGQQPLGKPDNPQQACEFLRLMSGKTHRVVTGIALFESRGPRRWSGVDVTEVSFRSLTDQEIDTYVASGEPMDRAGAYAIQGGAGKFVTETKGSWSNVVGLSMELFAQALKENGWNVGR